jgi:hypothetical protein
MQIFLDTDKAVLSASILSFEKVLTNCSSIHLCFSTNFLCSCAVSDMHSSIYCISDCLYISLRFENAPVVHQMLWIRDANSLRIHPLFGPILLKNRHELNWCSARAQRATFAPSRIVSVHPLMCKFKDYPQKRSLSNVSGPTNMIWWGQHAFSRDTHIRGMWLSILAIEHHDTIWHIRIRMLR